MRLFIFLLLFSCNAWSQYPMPLKENPISWGFTFSPDYCYRTLKGSDATSAFVIDYRNETEIPKFGFTTGINCSLKLKPRLLFETGVLLSDKGENERWTWLYSSQPDPLIPERLKFSYHYYYLDIPIKAAYLFPREKVDFFISSGISANIFLFQKTESTYIYSDGTRTSQKSTEYSLSPVNIAGNVGIGLLYRFNSSLRFKVEPTFRHSLFSIINAPVKGYLYSVGVNTGIFVRLQKGTSCKALW